MIEPLSSLWNYLADRFWAWLQFPWTYEHSREHSREHTYKRTCTRCGSTQELVFAFNGKPNLWIAIEPFNYNCPFH